MRKLAVSLAAAACFAAGVGLPGWTVFGQQAQAPATPPTAAPAGSGLIVGQVVDGTTGRPVGDAIVTLASGGNARGAAPAMPQPMPSGARMGGGAEPQRVQTDAQGRFVFRNLAAGTYNIRATKTGFLGGSLGQRSAIGVGRPVDLADSERLGILTVNVWPYGVITGVVSDDSGGPAVGLRMSLLRRTGVNRAWIYSPQEMTTTDDRGAYRFASIAPGTYLVAIRPESSAAENILITMLMDDQATMIKLMPILAERGEESLQIEGVRAYPTVFYPGAASGSQATPITVESGAERSGVNFRVSKVTVRKITGTLKGADVSQGSPPQLQMRRTDDSTRSEEPFYGSFDQKTGRFLFISVPPGNYLIQATSRPRSSAASPGPQMGAQGAGALPAPPADPTFHATLPITVGDKDLSDLVISLEPGARVMGRAEFTGNDRPAPDLYTRIGVTLEPADNRVVPQLLRGRFETDGTFKTASAPPGLYFVRIDSLTVPPSAQPASGRGAGPSAPWRPVSAMVGGRDALDAPIEIGSSDVGPVLVTFTNQAAASVTGTVRTTRGDVDGYASVVIFSIDKNQWADFGPRSRRVRTVKATRDGTFSAAGLIGGEYFVAVATEEQVQDIQGPGTLEALVRGATRVTLVDGQSRSVDVKSGVR